MPQAKLTPRQCRNLHKKMFPGKDEKRYRHWYCINLFDTYPPATESIFIWHNNWILVGANGDTAELKAWAKTQRHPDFRADGAPKKRRHDATRNDERTLEMRALKAQGWTNIKIAAKYDITPGAVVYHLKHKKLVDKQPVRQ